MISGLSGTRGLNALAAVLDCITVLTTRPDILLYGEMEIIKLNRDFEKEWGFSGADIFVSQDEHEPFEICGGRIKLYDWSGNYYELDMDGRLIHDTLNIRDGDGYEHSLI